MGAISGVYARQNRTYRHLDQERIASRERATATDTWYDSQVSDARAKVNEADAKIGAKFSEADAKLHNLAAEGKSQLQQATKDTGRELKQTADNFDHLVEKKASEAKSGISNWFGFGK